MQYLSSIQTVEVRHVYLVNNYAVNLYYISSLVLPGVAMLFKSGQVWYFYTDVTNINISWDLWKIHILYS